MSRCVDFPFALAAVFLWMGFVGAISFMEAWLKFRAPGITRPLGLGIGRLVFKALNRMEWIFALAILANSFFAKGNVLALLNLFYLLPLIILIVQTSWFLPMLDKRAQLHIDGKEVPPSKMHLVYVVCEIVKMICLAVFSVSLFK